MTQNKRKKQLESMSESEISKTLKTLAKRANQRLLTLERAGYADFVSAYSTAEQYILLDNITKGKSPNAKTRFSSAVTGRGKTEIVNEILQIEKFLKSKESTIKGVKEVSKKIAKSMGIEDSEKGERLIMTIRNGLKYLRTNHPDIFEIYESEQLSYELQAEYKNYSTPEELYEAVYNKLMEVM